jgi:ATP-dependent DNA helicase RecG
LGIEELQYIKGVGPQRAKTLVEAGINSSDDLINYFPKSYIDRNALQSIHELKNELKKQAKFQYEDSSSDFNIKSEVTIVAKVTSKNLRELKGSRQMLKLTISDSTATANIIFWNRAKYFEKYYKVGDTFAVSGLPELDIQGNPSFSHPEILIIDEDDEELYKSGKILPKYKISDKLANGGINQKILRKIIRSIFDAGNLKFEETLTESILRQFNYPFMKEAAVNLHFPESHAALERARNRLKFEEVFYYILELELTKKRQRNIDSGIIINQKSTSARKLYDSLPYQLTTDQKKTLRDIANDLANGKPMNRLIQGDVGSGKTIVAVLAMLMVIDAGYQAVFMAPTELLAEQHYISLKRFLEPLGIKIIQLVGGQKKKLRNEIIGEISQNEPMIIVGTHAVFQSHVEYNKLAIVVIDEQHRFGVKQRADLIEMSKKSLGVENISPHVLVVSATPIPRTLSLTVYGDLDISIIKTMPKNRKPIKTKVAFENSRNEVFEFVRTEIQKGRQAFIVYPLVEKSEKMELKAATEHYEYLRNDIFPDLKVGLLHGQMFWYEKDEAMTLFLNKEFDVLVATTVIEVGLDISNATVMVIEDAHRFGLSQLHQLRGRVGRGAEQSYCVLLTKDHYKFLIKKSSEDLLESQAAIMRLKTMERTSDGFEIAEVDLKLRGPGDIMGTRQSGLPAFDFVDLINDGEFISNVRNFVISLLSEDEHLRNKKNEVIRKTLIRMMKKNENFITVA